jgi:hypothetical protein
MVYQPELEDAPYRTAQDFGAMVYDPEARAAQIRHPEMSPQQRPG